MNATFSRIVSYLIVAIVLYFSFSIHVLLGIAAIVVMIGILMYSKRDAVYTQKAMKESGRGNLEEAVRLFDQAYRINPRNPATVANYAYISLKMGQIEKADQLLDKLLLEKIAGQIRSNIEMTHALVRWKQGRLDEAISMLERIQSQMKTTTLYGSLGYLYIERGDLARALEYNLEACDYNDSDAVILDNLFLTRILRHDWEQAEEIGIKLMELNPKFPEAYYHDGLLKLHKGDRTGALARFEEALDKPFTAVSTKSRETVENKRDEVLKSD